MGETVKEIPDVSMEIKEIPDSTVPEKKTTGRKKPLKKIPEAGISENTVMIGGKPIEIKPTKLKYHRNNTASFYKLVDIIPLPDIMTMGEETFGDGRDGDKALMDWLIAVTDNEELIRQNYNDMDTEVIERMLEIFKRVNRIDEKETRQKNAMSQGRKA